MTFDFKKMVRRNIEVTQKFHYEKGECKLDFSLRIDKPKDIKDFKECLVEALNDVDNLINKQ